MNKLRYYLTDKDDRCYLYLPEEEKEYNLEEITNQIHLLIDLKNKSVSKIHDFFHRTIVKKVVNNNWNQMVIDDSQIRGKIDEVEFVKLQAFIQEQVNLLNETLSILAEKNSKS